MPWRLLVFLLLIPLCGGEESSSENTRTATRTVDGEMLVKWEDTYYFDTESQPFTGRALSKFKDGTPKYDATIVNGKPHGLVTIFHQNGMKLFSASYQRGIQQGIEYNWHPNGTLQFSINYEQGQRHGKMTSWREDGSRQMDIFFSYGKIHGPFIVYDEQEEISTHRIYYDGKLANTRKTSDYDDTSTSSGAGPGLHNDIIEKEKYQPGQYNNPGYPQKVKDGENVAMYLTKEKKANATSYLWINDTIALPFKLTMQYIAKPSRRTSFNFGYSALAIQFNAQNQQSSPPEISENTGIIAKTGGYTIQLNTNKRRQSVKLYDTKDQFIEQYDYNPTTGNDWRTLSLLASKEQIELILNEEEVINFPNPQFLSESGLIAITAANGKHSSLHAIRNLRIESVDSPDKNPNIPNTDQDDPQDNEHNVDIRTIGYQHLIKKKDNLHYELGKETPFTGKILDYYQTGQLKLETHYEKGLMHGPHSLWYPDGSISVQTIYSRGKPSVKIKWDGEKELVP